MILSFPIVIVCSISKLLVITIVVSTPSFAFSIAVFKSLKLSTFISVLSSSCPAPNGVSLSGSKTVPTSSSFASAFDSAFSPSSAFSPAFSPAFSSSVLASASFVSSGFFSSSVFTFSSESFLASSDFASVLSSFFSSGFTSSDFFSSGFVSSDFLSSSLAFSSDIFSSTVSSFASEGFLSSGSAALSVSILELGTPPHVDFFVYCFCSFVFIWSTRFFISFLYNFFFLFSC